MHFSHISRKIRILFLSRKFCSECLLVNAESYVRVITEDQTLLFCWSSILWFVKGNRIGGRGRKLRHLTAETSLRPPVHNAILARGAPFHALCKALTVARCVFSSHANTDMSLPNSTCSRLNLLQEQGQTLNGSPVTGQHWNVFCRLCGSVIWGISWGNQMPFPYFGSGAF